MSVNNVSGVTSGANAAANSNAASNSNSLSDEIKKKYDLNGDGFLSDSEYKAAETQIYTLNSTATNNILDNYKNRIKSFGNTPSLISWDEMETSLKKILEEFSTSLSNTNLTITQRYKGIRDIINAMRTSQSNILTKLIKNINACGTETGKETLKAAKQIYSEGFDKYINDFTSLLNEIDFANKKEESDLGPKPALDAELKETISKFNSNPTGDNLKAIKQKISDLFGTKLSKYMNRETSDDEKKSLCKELEQLYQLDDFLGKTLELPEEISTTKKNEIYDLIKNYFGIITADNASTSEQQSNANIQKINILEAIFSCKNEITSAKQEAADTLNKKYREFYNLSGDDNTIANRKKLFDEYIKYIENSYLTDSLKDQYMELIYNCLTTVQNAQLQALQNKINDLNTKNLSGNITDAEKAANTAQIEALTAEYKKLQETSFTEEAKYMNEEILKRLSAAGFIAWTSSSSSDG